MRAPDLRHTRRRLRVAQLALAAAFLLLAGRAAHLALGDARAVKRGAAQVLSTLRLAPERGGIFDRDGAQLALTVKAPSVYVVPSAVAKPAATARALGHALRERAAEIAKRLRTRGPFVFVARWVSPAQAERVRALGLPGVGIVEEPRRTYPAQTLAAAYLGFANIDGRGVRGIEQMEDSWLEGTPRRVTVERDARGRLLLGPGIDPRSTAGGDVALTLSAPLEAEASRALGQAVQSTGARGGFVVCLDPRTGDVLAVAQRPSFDPNDFRAVPFAKTRSRVFLDAFEPGSTFKAFLAAAALQAGAVEPTERFDVSAGRIYVPGKWIHDDERHDGTLDLAGILRVSSNVGAVMVAQRLGPKRHWAMLRRFGFGAPTGSGFPDESAGLLRPWQRWEPLDQATIAFGQGVDVTPIQLAAAFGALANDGVWVRPRLIAARRKPGKTWQPTPPSPTRRVVSAATARRVVRMLEGVVTPEGTGGRAALEGVSVAGKTGTAQKVDRRTGTYAENRYVAWFAGVVPADAPRFVIVVGLDEPQRPGHTGGLVAAPVFAQVASAELTREGIPTRPAPERAAVARRSDPVPANDTSEPHPNARSKRPTGAIALRSLTEAGHTYENRRMPAQSSKPARASRFHGAERSVSVSVLGDRVLLPDFRGLTVEQVRRLVSNTPLVIEVRGRGRAVAQDPAPGTILAGGKQRVWVRFAPRGGES